MKIMTLDGNIAAIRRFYAWWLGALSALITPGRAKTRPWTTLLRHGEEGLEIVSNAGAAAVLLMTVKATAAADQPRTVKAALKKIARQSGHIVLRLSPGEVTERTVQIPKAASDVIEPVLHNQMNQIVPWPPEETLYGFEVDGANKNAPEQLDIRVVATTRSVLKSAIADAHALGLKPLTIDYAPGHELQTGIELMSLEPDPRQKTARGLHVLFVCLFGVSVAMGGFGFYQMWQRTIESRALENSIATARSRLAAIERHNAQSARLKELRERLVERKTGEPAVIMLVEALSRALPDNAFLTELEIRGNDLRIVGKSAEPTALIAKIESAPQFDDVHFAAPTTRKENDRLETFSVVARAGAQPLTEDKP